MEKYTYTDMKTRFNEMIEAPNYETLLVRTTSDLISYKKRMNDKTDVNQSFQMIIDYLGTLNIEDSEKKEFIFMIREKLRTAMTE